MAEVTIADLVALEPRLRLRANAPDASLTEVGWVVAARTAPPMLPTLRGGELVYFGEGAIAAAGQPWPLLLADLERLAAHGLIVPEIVAPAVPVCALPVLAFRGEGAPGEIEGMLNRALTEFRGELYRAGTDLGRLLGTLGASGVDAPRIVHDAATLIGLPVRFSAAGGPLAEHDPRSDTSILPTWEQSSIPGGFDAAVGWTDPRRAALARIGAERLAEALGAVARRAETERLRGPARTRGLARFLFEETSTDDFARRSAAFQLGVSPDADYRVAITPAAAAQDLARAAAAVVTPIEAGMVDGDSAWLLEGRAQRAAKPASIDRLADAVRSGWSGADRWLAVSSAVRGHVGLPDAAAEARFVAGLLRAGRIAGPIAAFDDARTLGPWQLLYQLREGDAVRAFAADILRELPSQDRRAELRRTLAIFLETGGASVEAARLLGIPRNTLAYRLRRIAILTGLDPLKPANRLSLQVALMALEVSGEPN